VFRRVALLAVMIVVVMPICACERGLEILKPTGSHYPVIVSAYRLPSAHVHLPKSEYTIEFGFGLDSSFYDLEDPSWWSRFRQELVEKKTRDDEDWDEERYGEPWINEVPPIEWLEQNARRSIVVFWPAMICLPEGGTLRKAVIQADFEVIREKYPGETEQIVLEDEHLFFAWQVIEFRIDSGVYQDSLDFVQEAFGGKLLYAFPDGKRFLVIELPEQFLELDEEHLGIFPYWEIIHAEILEKR
jgi:hypothetical protein